MSTKTYVMSDIHGCYEEYKLMLKKINFSDDDTLAFAIKAHDGQYDKSGQPKVGPFYYYKDTIIALEIYQRNVNPILGVRASRHIDADAGEHRDMWDKYMTIIYPELKQTYNDDHKALSRGRVDFKKEKGELKFWVTLDKCIPTDKESKIIQLYNLTNYDVEFRYGTMNYQCIQCM